MSTDNPSAFPPPYPGSHGEKVEKGMSLHTYQWTQFAKSAPPIPAEFSVPTHSSFDSYDESYQKAIAWMAEWACDYADAMMAVIAERAKPTKPAPIASTLYPRQRIDE